MPNQDFYRDLKVYPNFQEIANPDVYTPVPEDWQVVITDVKGSTKAIEAGKVQGGQYCRGYCLHGHCQPLQRHGFPLCFWW